jgi:quercetin dioxygenase-like cupin family protein
MAQVEVGEFGSLPVESPFRGVERRCFHSERSTVSRYSFEPGARFPLHRHPEEQVTLIEAGSVEFSIGGEVHRLGPGAWTVVAGEVEHGIVAGEDGALIVAIVSPRRAAADAYTVVGQ